MKIKRYWILSLLLTVLASSCCPKIEPLRRTPNARYFTAVGEDGKTYIFMIPPHGPIVVGKKPK